MAMIFGENPVRISKRVPTRLRTELVGHAGPVQTQGRFRAREPTEITSRCPIMTIVTHTHYLTVAKVSYHALKDVAFSVDSRSNCVTQ